MIKIGLELEDGAIRRARGLALHVAQRRAAAEQRHTLVRQLYEQGRSIVEIARATNYASSTVRQLVAAKRPDYRARDARVCEVYQEGHSTIETARLTGVHRSQVGRIIQRAGISRRPGPQPRAGVDAAIGAEVKVTELVHCDGPDDLALRRNGKAAAMINHTSSDVRTEQLKERQPIETSQAG